MNVVHDALLLGAAVIGGALNSVAGGGSFLTFPSLIFVGIPAITANATSTVALWPGSIASVGAYRREIAAQDRRFVLLMSVTSVVGGVLGAILLLKTPQSTFVALLPFLLLVATVLFAFSKQLTAQVRAFVSGHSEGRPASEMPTASGQGMWGLMVVQLVIALYGGYFGGGIGILMLASLGVMGMTNIHMMNGIKTLLATCINGVAVLTFAVAGAVAWPQAILMVVGAIAGGYGGAHYARQLPPLVVRRFVIVVGTTMTAYFFIWH